MEPALKQRVVGAAVLVALAVIFLPMLIKGPAPESGVSDVPLKLPDAPQGDGTLQTRELPLVAPGAAPASGVVGLDASDARTDDAAELASNASTDASPGTAMMPAATAGGDYAVSFGRYASATDADKVVAALRASQLPGYQESTTDAGRTLYRVRIGPYATQADAEAARLRAAHVRDDVGAKVVVLDAAAAQSEPAAASQPVAAANAPVSKPEPLATEPKPAASKPTTTTTKPTAPPATTKPAATTTAAAPKPAQPAASGTGFAVQLGAFASATEATKLRDRARAAGMRAFVDSVRTDKGVLSRVRVGPVLTRAEADQLKAQVAAKLGIGDAIVKPHP
jgi:cell division septation protein DedD